MHNSFDMETYFKSKLIELAKYSYSNRSEPRINKQLTP